MFIDNVWQGGIEHISGNLYFRAGGQVDRMTIKTGGNVGIGTTSPEVKLEIADSEPIIRLTDTRNLNNPDWDDVTLGRIQFKTSDTTSPAARVVSEIEAYSNSQAASAPNSELRFKTSTNTESTATTKMVISDVGNVGIGTANPSQKLHVVGNARVTGAYYDSNNSPGIANQVLVSTATGTDWVDGSSSGIIGGPYLPLVGGTMSGNTNHSDNVKDRYGTGNDFQIWHDGSNTFLSNEGEGHLNIINTGDDRDIVFKTDDGSGATTSYMVIDGSAEQTRFYKDTRHTDGVVANFW